MAYETESFIIYYNECDKNYIDKIINILKLKAPSIIKLFKLDKIEKITIKLYNSLDAYKQNITTSFLEESKKNNTEPRQYQDWMIANTEDGNINMLSLDLVKKIYDFKNYTEDEFCYNAAHEFVHICQQKVNSTNPGWFWEVLATTLGNPECQSETDEKFTLKDLEENFDIINGYGAVYKIGRYLFTNNDYDYIFELITNNEKLKEISQNLIDNSRSLNKTI